MIADLDETIRQLLIDDLPITNGEIDVNFDQPKRDWSSRISKPTINLFLYDVRENNVLRQHQWERLNGSSGRDIASLKRTPMRVDCSYIMTAWAADVEDEHRLLTRTMLTLFRHPTLPNHRLVGSLQNPPYEIQARVARHDKLTDPSDLWNVMDNEIRPGISYVITLALDPWQEITAPIVRTRTLRFGEAQHLPYNPGLRPDDRRTDLVVIAGTVRHRSDQTPLSGVEVAVKGTGRFATTDAEGHFVLGSLPPGDYTLVAWHGESKPQEKTITLPAGEGDYDMDV
jgi:hypothetical protein